jgi:hypothetical protein
MVRNSAHGLRRDRRSIAAAKAMLRGMLGGMAPYALAGMAIASLVVVVAPARSFAGPNDRRSVIVVHPRRCFYTAPYEAYAPPCAYQPYYYSAWNPFSVYSVYDHLSGGRQLCNLPTEPCDNTHRVTN